MLIEFTVENFRSIREPQTLSLVAANADKGLENCLIKADIPGMSGISYVKAAGIYGANASGKSNMIQALHFVSNFVTRSATRMQPGDPTGANPFKLDKESVTKPSRFEITFVAEGVKYLYAFSMDSTRILEEALTAYPKGLPQHWVDRVWNPKDRTYTWAKPSTQFKHDKSLEEKTRENALFLSTGPQFNHPQLMTLYTWFRNSLFFLDSEISGDAEEYTLHLLSLDNGSSMGNRGKIIALLKHADLGIKGIRLKTNEDFLDYTDIEVSRMGVLEKSLTQRPIQWVDEVKLLHTGLKGTSVPMDYLDEESEGTKRIFEVAGPWIRALERGQTIVVDELESSLHPNLVRELIKLFLSNETNPKGAQLIFTTHNPTLLDTTFLRRDQIWFTEKNQEGATSLYPLTDYKPRNNEALAKGYLAGRYGGIPFIPEGLWK